MPREEFAIDPRNKFGNADWEEGLDDFVAALNGGGVAALRPDGVEGMAELPRENVLDANSLGQLKSLFLNYR